MISQEDQYKKIAAVYAIDTFIESGMILGLGTGTTSRYAIAHLGAKIQAGVLRDIIGIPTSENAAEHARTAQIPLGSLDDTPHIDLTFDGADEIDPHLNLIKGGGGALLREKIVAQASRLEIIIADETKLVDKLGQTWALPIEVVAFGIRGHEAFLQTLGGEPQLRRKQDGSPFVTDQGNLILDTSFGPIDEPAGLAQTLNNRAGIVEHGLFLGLATQAIIAGKDGIRNLYPPNI